MALRLWNLPSDAYDSQQLADNFARIDQHDHSFGKGLQIGTGGIQDTAITGAKLAPGAASQSIPAGGISADQLADAARLGVTGSTVARRGAVNIVTAETTASTSYTLLTTPDRVASIVLPSNGLIAVLYQATWQASAADAGRAAIFIGSNQAVRAAQNVGGPPAQETESGGGLVDCALYSCGYGLETGAHPGASYTGDVTTGQIIGGGFNANESSLTSSWSVFENGPTTNDITGAAGGACYLFATAGTYDVSIRFKAASTRTVTAKNRKLWVWTIGF